MKKVMVFQTQSLWNGSLNRSVPPPLTQTCGGGKKNPGNPRPLCREEPLALRSEMHPLILIYNTDYSPMLNLVLDKSCQVQSGGLTCGLTWLI